MKTYPITPIGKPRMTHRDKHRPIHKRYFKFCNDARMLKIGLPPYGAHVIFVLPMAKSWSKQRKAAMNGQRHEQKPDLDNLLKSLGDAIYKDDSKISDIRVSKKWGHEGAIIIK